MINTEKVTIVETLKSMFPGQDEEKYTGSSILSIGRLH